MSLVVSSELCRRFIGKAPLASTQRYQPRMLRVRSPWCFKSSAELCHLPEGEGVCSPCPLAHVTWSPWCLPNGHWQSPVPRDPPRHSVFQYAGGLSCSALRPLSSHLCIRWRGSRNIWKQHYSLWGVAPREQRGVEHGRWCPT